MRFGAVAYINALPLIEGLAPVVLDTPAALARRQEAGEVDVALLPVAAGESLGLQRVGSLGIACEGAVESVLLFLRTDIEEVETLAHDPASRTSSVLSEVLLKRRWEREPRRRNPPADAELVIGDAALQRAESGERHLDLGTAWTEWTGLPFVFAAWYGDPAAGPALEEAYGRGLEKIPQYAREARLGLPAERLERYLRERIRYRLGPREEEGLARFLGHATDLDLV